MAEQTTTAAGAGHRPSQRYLSTRGKDHDLSFETVVMNGLASDGGLYLPEEIPDASTTNWQQWRDLSFPELAFQIFSLYISRDEIPAEDLKGILHRSYSPSAWRSKEVTPLTKLDGLHVLELFHGPTFAFKDVALQTLGNLFEYFLLRKNEGKVGHDRHHLTVIGATSGDTGSAAIYGLRGKKDVDVFILHPRGRVSPIQEAQMTTVLDSNVHNIAVKGTFDDCQDIVKALFADPEINEALNLGAVNSINWARVLAQITYYFFSYFSLCRADSSFKLGDKLRFVVPTGNFGDILAGYFAYCMGLPVEKLVIATNENDILHRFWQSGRYEKKPTGSPISVADMDDVRETLSPAMDILVSSNFERLLWFMAHEQAIGSAGVDDAAAKKQASQEVSQWLADLKSKGGFQVPAGVLETARRDFESERVSDQQTVETIKATYVKENYILDPHSAVGVCAAQRSASRSTAPHIALSTAHPAKFAKAVDMALKNEPGYDFEGKVLPPEFFGLEKKEKRVKLVDSNSWQEVGRLVRATVEEQRQSAS